MEAKQELSHLQNNPALPPLRIKICGITNARDAYFAAELGADAIGFIFVTSPRRIDPLPARAISRELPDSVMRIGIFHDHTPAHEILETIESAGLTGVQLVRPRHHEATHAFGPRFTYDRDHHLNLTQALKAQHPSLYVIQTIEVDGPSSLDTLKEYGACDAFLFDTPRIRQPQAARKPFDWNLLQGEANAALDGKKFFLAGGLTPENVASAVRGVRPYGIDVSSGVEASPGVKDHDKLRAFFMAAKGALQ
jgi:phosphoribosylanthranilate isomerase